MPTMTIDPGYPNLLIVAGTDVFDEDGGVDRDALRDAVFSSDNPLGNQSGLVDFFVCFSPESPASNGGGLHDHTLSPHPLRSIVQLGIPLDTLPNLGRFIGGTFAQELGHYWLVPGNATIRQGNAEVTLPTSEEIWTALNAGKPTPALPIVVRDGSHGSQFMHAEPSPVAAVA